MRAALAIVFVLVYFATAQTKKAAQPAFFDNKVKPILCDRCIMCHNDNLKNGNVSFLHRDGLLAAGPHGTPIVPGKPEESVLIRVVRHDGDVTMPPGSKLPAQNVNTLIEWIRRGAPWQDGPLSCPGRSTMKEQERRR